MSSTACSCVGRFGLCDTRLEWVVVVRDPQCVAHPDAA